MYREQQLATTFTVLLSAICFVAVFICYWYPFESALVAWSVVSIIISFILAKEQLKKVGLSFMLNAFFIVPLALSMKDAPTVKIQEMLVFAAVSAIVVTFSAILLEKELRISPIIRVFQLAKRLIKVRRLRIALSLLTISVYATSITVMSPVLQSLSLFLVSGIAICVIMNTALSDVHQKKNEFLTLAAVGLNPDHFVGLVLAEVLIMSFIGGGIGYGVGFWIKYLTSSPLPEFRLLLMTMVEVILVSNTVGFAASIIPASRASMIITPSLLKRWWREASPTSEWPPKWTFAVPVKVTEDNVEDFLYFYMKRLPLSEWFTKNIERIYDLRLEYPDTEQSDQKKAWKLTFKYSYGDGTHTLEAVNDLIAFKSLETNEIKIMLTIKVIDYNDPQLAQRVDKYLEIIGSAFRMLAFEWTKGTEKQ